MVGSEQTVQVHVHVTFGEHQPAAVQLTTILQVVKTTHFGSRSFGPYGQGCDSRSEWTLGIDTLFERRG